MEASEVLEWRYYLAVEPRAEDRVDYNSAQICQAIYTVIQSLGSKGGKPIPLEDCLLKFEHDKKKHDKKNLIKNAMIMSKMFGGVEKLNQDIQKHFVDEELTNNT